MLKQWQWVLREITKRLWFRAGLFSILGMGTALLALLLRHYIPEDVSTRIGADAVDNILEIIASSMLAATTFSLNIMVSAYASATNNVTPRATPLLVEDATTQNVLATFIGSFLFSLVGIIALSTGLYGNSGRVVLFAVTVVVVLVIVYTLLRWIDHLARLGRVGETIDRVEAATIRAMKDRHERPFLGGNRLAHDTDISMGARAVLAPVIGYVRHIDIQALAELGSHSGGAIYVTVLPGSFVDTHTPIAYVGNMPDVKSERIEAAFLIGNRRSFEQDPRFGISVLAEIASRALSPALNDVGTAIDVIGRGVRVLSISFNDSADTSEDAPAVPNVFVAALDPDDLFDDFFGPIARDGAGTLEVGIRLQKSLHMLARKGEAKSRSAAIRHADFALRRAEAALVLEEDKKILRDLRHRFG